MYRLLTLTAVLTAVIAAPTFNDTLDARQASTTIGHWCNNELLMCCDPSNSHACSLVEFATEYPVACQGNFVCCGEYDSIEGGCETAVSPAPTCNLPCQCSVSSTSTHCT